MRRYFIMAKLFLLISCSKTQNLAHNAPMDPAPVHDAARPTPEMTSMPEENPSLMSELTSQNEHSSKPQEGPKSRAQFIPDMGEVNFPITVMNSDENVQKFFNQGLAQLHGFWNFEAERSFLEAYVRDTRCGMCLWGVAMANTIFGQGSPARASEYIEFAMGKKDALTEKEKRYIEALNKFYDKNISERKIRAKNFVQALKEIIEQYPEDLDAKAFYAVFSWDLNLMDEMGESHDSISQLLNEIFAKNPKHPAHHYKIHLWDGINNNRALDSASLSGLSASGVAHQWHMSGHIYSKLKRYADTAFHQDAALRIDNEHLKKNALMPYQIHNYLHDKSWLVMTFAQVGALTKVVELAKDVIAEPAHPSFNSPLDPSLQSINSLATGQLYLLKTLEDFGEWEMMQNLFKTPYFSGTLYTKYEISKQRSLGVASYHMGDILTLLRQKDLIQAMSILPQFTLDQQNALRELEAYLNILKAQNKKDKIKEVKKIEKLGLSSAASIIHLYLSLDQFDSAEVLARNEVETRHNELIPLANLVYVLVRKGNKDEAQHFFKILRELSSDIDLNAAPFKRLSCFLPDLGLDMKKENSKETCSAIDWRLPYKAPADIRDKRLAQPLADFGEFHRIAPTAPAFTLTSAINEYSKVPKNLRATLYIFFKGTSCIHCVQQLNGLYPKLQEFLDLGVSVKAISPETEKELGDKITAAWADKDQQPNIKFFADPECKMFKSFGAYDEFKEALSSELSPIHGTFLISEEGKILWKDVGEEPFMNMDFLLKESERLLDIHTEVIYNIFDRVAASF